jgi:integrase
MATISQYRGKWKAQIRKEGYPPQTKTFARKADAVAWGVEIEAQMNRQAFAGSTTAQTMTVDEMLSRYLREESPSKASGRDDIGRAKPLLAALGKYRVHNLSSPRVSQYKTDRLRQVAAQTVTHELNLLHRAYVIASSEWGVILPNGIPKTKRPALPRGRDRRVSEKDVALILENTDSAELGTIVRLAIETAMRRSELLGIRWEDVNFERRSVYLSKTKTDVPRTVPLSTQAVLLLQGIGPKPGDRIFSISPNAATRAFCRAVQRAGIEDLRFHDLRHEATSRLFERGLNVIEVARITGHKTLAMLDRYTHLDVGHLVSKLG